MHRETPAKTALNRRDFIKASVAGSAALATSAVPHVLSAEEKGSAPESHAELQSLSPGAIRPEGWVRAHLESQARLTSVLPDISYPFSGGFWEGEENSPVWFTWEQKAYWVDGATRLGLLLGDEEVLAKARRSLDYTLTHPTETGFLGPKFLEMGVEYGTLNRWPNNVLFRGYMALADAQPAPTGVDGAAIADAIRKHYLNDKAPYDNGGRNITNVEIMLWCYGRTGDRRLLEMAQNAWDTYIKDAEADFKAAAAQQAGARRRRPSHSDLAPSRVFANTPIQTHGVSYAETSKLPAILYFYTGDDNYRKFAAAAQQRIFDHHMLIDGIPSSSEGFAGTTALDEHETCDITDHTWTWAHVMMATGDGKYGDAIERACFNAHAGTTRTDWKGFQYFSSPNQVIATLNSDHGTMRPGSRRLAYQPNPAQFIACCGGNKHRFFPNYVMNMWMKTRQNGLAATLYGPSTVSAKVGAANQPVQIAQATNYPFSEEIRFEIKADSPVNFPLSLRIPAWCDSPQVKINSSPVTATKIRNGFLVLDRTFHTGEVITLNLPMKVKTTSWPQNGIAVERGPLVYALPVDAKWSSLPEDAYSSEEFPTWEAVPVSPWNYGLALEPGAANAKVKVKQRPSSRNLEASSWPWSDAPVVLTVPARRLKAWELRVNPNDSRQKFTPSLDDARKDPATENTEEITLVPFGATQLRLSIFPKLES